VLALPQSPPGVETNNMFSMRTSAAMAVAALVTCASLAASPNQKKFTTITPFGVGLTENPGVDGVAKLTYQTSQSVTHMSLVVHGLLADTGYVIFTSCDLGGQEFEVTTNSQGKFTLNADCAVDLPNNNPVLIISRGTTDLSVAVAFAFPD